MEKLNNKLLYFIINILFIMIMIILALHWTSPKEDYTQPKNTTEGAIEMIHYAFGGHYSESMVEQQINLLFTKYNIEKTDENYLKIGNELVNCRKKSNGMVHEMDIIDDMILAIELDSTLLFSNQFETSAHKFLRYQK